MNELSKADAGDLFVTGATGYIGGRLVPRLLAEGYGVRCLARSLRKLKARTWAGHERIRLIEGDLEAEEDLADEMRGCHAAYYLAHSMIAAGRRYAEHDRKLAAGFARACARAGVGRIIYLGGLGESGEGLSQHLNSRREIEIMLASSGVPVTVFRAAMIIGSGSASFEILRYLVERLPVMLTPRWVQTECQPIGVANVLHYLVACLGVPETRGVTLDIGGADVRTYRELMDLMAEARGLRKRWVIPVPVLTPRLSSLWIHGVTPINHRIARPLAEGLRNRVVCRDNRASKLMPQKLLSAREAIELALKRRASGKVETAWSDAGPIPGDPDWAGGKVFTDELKVEVAATPEQVFRAVCRIGGGHGYYAAGLLWRIRGWMDRCVGGPGLRRGRRDPKNLKFGDALDFWRVTGVVENEILQLRAEMKVPGEALLEFRIRPLSPEGQRCELVQCARFLPRGLGGLVYWYLVLPFHGFVFHGMINGIKRFAEKQQD